MLVFLRHMSVVLAMIITLPLVAADHTKDSLEKVRELIAAKKAILVDVREKSEWDAGHIQGAKLVPMSILKAKLSDERLRELLPADKVIYLYCAGGVRCLDVAETLKDRKLDLKPLKQGYQTLLKEGFAIAKPEATQPASSVKK